VYLGGAHVNENFIDDTTDDRDYFSLALGDELKWKFPWGLTVEQRLDVYPSLEDTSDVLFNFFFGPRYTLANGLFTGVASNWDYDTKPARFRERNDFRYLGTLGHEFQETETDPRRNPRSGILVVESGEGILRQRPGRVRDGRQRPAAPCGAPDRDDGAPDLAAPARPAASLEVP